MVTVIFLIYMVTGLNGIPENEPRTLMRFENMNDCQLVVLASKSKDLSCMELNVLKGREDKPFNYRHWS